MKTWNTIQNMGEDIAEIDRLTQMEKQSGIKELNAAQCSHVASIVKRMYMCSGKDIMIRDLKTELKTRMLRAHQSTGLTSEEKNRALDAVKKLFKWYWFPFSKIRKNMKNLTK
jgi:site-specific recombinase XerD